MENMALGKKYIYTHTEIDVYTELETGIYFIYQRLS